MKVGIYIDGLGQSVAEENAISYATRLKNELNYHHTGVEFDLKVERILLKELDTNAITIFQVGKQQKAVYKLFEFDYSEMLTKDFNTKNILYKNYLLFSIVFKKFPILLKRIIFPTKGYNFTFQTFYIFTLFFVIAAAILFMIPSTIAVLSNFSVPKGVADFIKDYHWLHNIASYIKNKCTIFNTEHFVSLIALIILVIPNANSIITRFASEFVSAHLYLQFGHKKQDITGKIDDLIEYITENEDNPEIHFHTYSFGTLVAIDYLFPYGQEANGNMLERTKGLITIGSPYDFINSYYPNHYLERNSALESQDIKWINVYSISDALGSNFRNQPKKGDSDYGIGKNKLKPININYEVANLNSTSFFNFILLNNLKIHGMYWSTSTGGRSCLNPIYMKMVELGMI